MVSDDRIRAGVARIANAVEVDTDTHLAAVVASTRDRGRTRAARSHASSRRRFLVPLTAAASVIGVLAAGSALTGIFTGSEPGGNEPALQVLDGTPDGTMPSVFGQTRESAGALLREQGLQVRYGRQISCDPAGRPVGTEPATGSPVQPGDAVTVLL